ncbi:MAG TPA: arabinosyltransferase domain-containing protein [Mycobacterium sp.]|nr:arabinosyltransferase domain-containing protein [Mycobacterium sp.]
MVIGLFGVVAALVLPFAPVYADSTTVTWPVPGQQVTSSTAIFAPYRPVTLNASIPCRALNAPETTTVLETATPGDGLTVTAGAGSATVQIGDRRLDLRIPADADCAVSIDAGPDGLRVTGADGGVVDLSGERPPKVFGFRTDLAPAQAAGMTVTASTAATFSTSPTPLKIALIGAQILAVALALALLSGARPTIARWRPRLKASRLWWVDGAVVATLCGWAVIGPLSVDDGWATTIARTIASTGNPGNYYRWWNAAESPFALSQQILAPLTEISLAPLWLRLPSTVLAIATWFALSRGVLGAALPSLSATIPVRVLAAVSLLAAWLPFNLGTRPEAYVALGVTATLALALRIRGPVGLGWLALVVAVTLPISPNSILVLAPILVFAPRIVAALRHQASSTTDLVARVLLLCCVAALAITLVFADQTWDGFLTSTDWHTFFGPSFGWYDEPDRYRYLLQNDQQGSAAKRLPVLLSIAMLPVALLGRRDRAGGAALRFGGIVVVSLVVFALMPSKWSYHFGAIAGLLAAFLTVSVVAIVEQARSPDRRTAILAGVASLLLCASAALAFAGPNAWWLSATYDVPWPSNPIRPGGLRLNNPALWLAVLAALVAAYAVSRRSRLRQRAKQAQAAGPALIVFGALVIGLAVLVGSFVAAPFRRAPGSLALMNLHRISGEKACGLADDIEVLPDGDVLRSAEPGGRTTGFVFLGGYHPDSPPPVPVGTGASAFLWGSDEPDPSAVGSVTTQWFALPAMPPTSGVALSVSGRTDRGNALAFEFGRSTDAGVVALGERTPIDREAVDEDPRAPLWRTIGVSTQEIPVGADRVRVRAVDNRTDPTGWLAFTGPRLRSTIPLTDMLAAHGPVLIGWPQGFLFPCVRNIADVSDGLAQTPGIVIESPRPRFAEDRDPQFGGTFRELAMFGRLHEIPSQLRGHPDIDWGAVLVSEDPAARDAYRRSVSRVAVPGVGATRGLHPER